MPTVSYGHEFAYRQEPAGPFPIVLIRISNPANADLSLDVDGYLDSGATASLLPGWMAQQLGFELLAGPVRPYTSAAGPTFEARVHTVQIAEIYEAAAAPFLLEVGFALGEIHRNILGRDFFNHVQLGFRERQLLFFLTPSP